MVNPDSYPEEDREFNRYTLLGEYDSLFIALVKQRCYHDGVNADLLPDFFRAHVNRGVMLLNARIKSLADVTLLIPNATRL